MKSSFKMVPKNSKDKAIAEQFTKVINYISETNPTSLIETLEVNAINYDELLKEVPERKE